MAEKIEAIEGIGPKFGQTLFKAGIATTDDLLKNCGTSTGRKSTAEKTGLSEVQLLKWTNMADLMRIKGVGPEYAELLEAAGVDTVKELKTRRADNLTAKLSEVQTAKRLTRRVPAETEVERWISEAAGMKPAVSY